MNDIQLSTTDYDLLVKDGDILLFDTIESLTVQKVKINLLNFKGEWFRDIDTGIPYIQDVFGKRGTKEATDALIKNAILSTENITALLRYDSSISDNRTLQVVFSAKTQSGTLTDITVEV